VLDRDGERWKPALQSCAASRESAPATPSASAPAATRFLTTANSRWRQSPRRIRRGSPGKMAAEVAAKTHEPAPISPSRYSETCRNSPAGGVLHELQTPRPAARGPLDYSALPATGFRDAHGAILRNPARARKNLPAPCRDCPELDRYCRRDPHRGIARLRMAPARPRRARRHAHRSRRPLSFFNNGEGLAVAGRPRGRHLSHRRVVFDLANLRAGHRFARGRVPVRRQGSAQLCQRVYERADIPATSRWVRPGATTAAGASEVVRIHPRRPAERETPHRFPPPGRTSSAPSFEWRSLVRHIASGRHPDHPNPRWNALKSACAKQIEASPAKTPRSNLPALCPPTPSGARYPPFDDPGRRSAAGYLNRASGKIRFRKNRPRKSQASPP